MSRNIGCTCITRPLVPILLCFVVLSWVVNMRKLGRGEEKEVKREKKRA